MADELSLDVAVPFETVEKEEEHVYQTFFEDHPEGKGIVSLLDTF